MDYEPAEASAILATRLRARYDEIEEAVLNRVHAVSEPASASSPEYVDGLRAAVCTAIDYGLTGIEGSPKYDTSIPVLLRVQAQLAAREKVSLDTVLRRYLAGYTLLGDFLVEVAEIEGLPVAALKKLLRIQAERFDRLLEVVTDDYTQALSKTPASTDERRVEEVERLLEGELIQEALGSYGIKAFHMGAVATGEGAEEALREVATSLRIQALMVRRGDATMWAWLGSPRPLDPNRTQDLVSGGLRPGISMALGEPGWGVSGWRRTHRQAKACSAIAFRSAAGLVRYADVALLASIVRDDLLSASLQEIYLQPLYEERDGGVLAKKTLETYFASNRNVSSAASLLQVNRHTVTRRLRMIESRIGRPLERCAGDLELALRLESMLKSRASV